MSGAEYDDPRIAVGPGVLTELKRERKRIQNARPSDTASSHLGSRDVQRTGGELCIVANRGRIRAAEGIGGRVKFLPLAWAGMPKTSFRKNSDSLCRLVLALTREVSQLKAHQNNLQETIRLLLHKRFDAKSEKYPAEQSDLFNEAEAYAEDESTPQVDADDSPQADAETDWSLGVTTPSSAKRGRKALPTEFPRADIAYELPEGQRHCSEGHALVVIGEDVSEQLDIIPAKIQVLRHIRKKYACPCCSAGVKTAPLPPQPIPKSNASAGLLAYIVTAKFLDALPLYRQSKQFQRIGVHLPRATLANWMIRCGALIQPLHNVMQEQLNNYPIQQMDETTVQVLKEDGKAASNLSYMWVQRGGPPEQPVILFNSIRQPEASPTLTNCCTASKASCKPMAMRAI